MPRSNAEDRNNASLAYGLDRSRNVRDITGDYPAPGDLETRAECERDFKRFCEVYFPNAFNLAWSDDHIRAISRMEEVILGGGLFALAMPRGAGKTTLSIRAAIWALLYGHRRFVCLVASTEHYAQLLLKPIKTELTFNERLARDFRQVCYPLARLENNGRKCIGQLFDGEQTRIEWGKDHLTFPTMPDWACDGPNVSGSAVSVAGLTGALRGQSHTLATGEVIRPEVVILDDPQTRESAMSRTQSENRAAIIKGDVLGMAGPGRDIAAIMPCTVIRDGDMTSEMLDRGKNPEWSGQRTKMVYAFPVAEALWDQYHQIRDESLRADRDGSEATEFYAAHRAEMDEGARVAWPERFKPKAEISAIQHAMNLLHLDRHAFFAEYQNEPIPEDEARPDLLAADAIAAKVNRIPRGVVPIECTRLTAFIDVHQDVLYYAVVGWDDHFGGSVVDYGTYPDQKRAYFALRDATNTLGKATKAAGVEGRIYAGLGALADAILAREWARDDGLATRVERCLVDAGWGNQSDVVYKFCRESAHAAALVPSHGRGIGASQRPMTEYAAKPGERVGFHWYMPLESRGKRSIRKVIFDANFWKSFVHARLAVAPGDKGGLSLFGPKPSAHRLYADHLTAEYPVAIQRVGSSRVVDEWKPVVGRPDNHWLDCTVGCAVAASMGGSALPEAEAVGARAGRVSFRDLQKKRRA
jgi:hypothetical protein